MLALRHELQASLKQAESKLRNCGADEFQKLQGECNAYEKMLALLITNLN